MLVTADKARGCQGPGDPPRFQVRLIGVDAVYTDWGTPDRRAVAPATPAWMSAQAFAGGSMGAEGGGRVPLRRTTGGRAAIGQLEAIPGLIAGTAGTQIDGRDPAVEYCG